MKVMHVIGSLRSGGIEHLLVKSLARLKEGQFDHQVCCIWAGGVYETDLKAMKIPYTIMNRRARFDPTLPFQMAHLMKQERIELVHTLNFTANSWGRLAGKLAGISRLIAHERGTAWTATPLMRLFDRLFYPWTERLLANSEAAKIVLTRHVGLKPDRIRVVYNGVPEPTGLDDRSSLRKRLNLSPETPLIGTVGRLDTPKGLPFLVAAMPLVWQEIPEAHFVIIGDGPLRDYLAREAEWLQPGGRFHLAGFVPDAYQTMSELDIVVHPSIRESLGNVLIEAGFARRAVVASNVDGCAEVVVHDKTGLLVDCTEPVEYIPVSGATPLPKVVVDGRTRQLRPPLGPAPADLAGAIVALLRDPVRREEMGRQGQARARQQFSLEQYVYHLEQAYRGEL